MHGTDISPVEVAGVTKHGFWILLDEKEELFVSFLEFPWFRKAPELDIDLHVDSIRHPETFPLVSQPTA
ncbi:MAG: DUF2442 domain-containing protein [Methylobacter tundripaludum]|nr:DUF2442 domain-containing protein [Methylobacter tundripaludum]